MSDIPFDAVTTLFVFLIGVPAIVLQTLPSDIRRVVIKRWRRLLADLAIPVVLALLLVWTGGVLASGRGLPRGWTWTAELSALFLIAVYAVFRILSRYGRRTAVVRGLEREVASRLPRTGHLVEDALHDLIELGKQSGAGRDKEWVLRALANLADATCRSPRYDGDGLGDLVLGVLDIVVAQPLGRSPQNFSTAADVLSAILMRYEADGEQAYKHADLIASIRALSRLGRDSLALGNESVALEIVQALGTPRLSRADIFVSQALYEVGVAAIELQQTLIAMAALEKLMVLVEAREPARGELVADTLGLLAHFWATGPTGREYAGARLERIPKLLAQDLESALAGAARHCAQTTQFRTADLVRAMHADLLQGATAPG